MVRYLGALLALACLILFPAAFNQRSFDVGQNQFYVCTASDGLNCTAAGRDVGTCSSWAKACLTIGYAIGQAESTSSDGFRAASYPIDTINLGGGTFNESVVVWGCPVNAGGSGQFPFVCIMFNGAGHTHTTWDGSGLCGTLISEGSATVGVQNMTMKGDANGCQSTLFADRGGRISTFNDLVFGTATIEHMHSENSGSLIEIWAGYTITGGSGAHWTVATSGLIIQSCQGFATTCVITLSGSPTFTEFIFGDANGTVYLNTIASSLFSGAAGGGKKYAIQGNVVIQTGGACASIPGTGTTVTTGAVCE